jgi:hypothetical protein
MPGLDYGKRDIEVEWVERWIVFGREGGRYGQANVDADSEKSPLDRLHTEIKEAEEQTGAAIVVRRREPKMLEIAEHFPTWLATKKGKRPKRQQIQVWAKEERGG